VDCALKSFRKARFGLEMRSSQASGRLRTLPLARSLVPVLFCGNYEA
jgi:hypothetical protein